MKQKTYHTAAQVEDLNEALHLCTLSFFNFLDKFFCMAMSQFIFSK